MRPFVILALPRSGTKMLVSALAGLEFEYKDFGNEIERVVAKELS